MISLWHYLTGKEDKTFARSDHPRVNRIADLRDDHRGRS